MLKIPPTCVTAWVTRHFPDHKFRKGGEQIRVNNPFIPDNSYNVEINTRLLCVNDFRDKSWVGLNPHTGQRQKCTFVRFVQLYLTKTRGSCSFRAALEDIMGSATAMSAILADYHKPKVEEKQAVNLDLPPGSRPIDLISPDPSQQLVINYLHKRKITDEKIAKYQMQAAGLQVIWPYYEFDEICYYQARSLINKKFLFPDENVGVTKGEFLYGFDLVEPASYLIITEAIIDAQTLEEQCVATGGADMTDPQVKKIKLLGPKEGIILAADNDLAGIKSIISNAKLLEPVFGLIYYSLPDKIGYIKDGKKELTKDWNDIAVFTEEDPVAMLRRNILPLNIQNKVKLRTLLAA